MFCIRNPFRGGAADGSASGPGFAALVGLPALLLLLCVGCGRFFKAQTHDGERKMSFVPRYKAPGCPSGGVVAKLSSPAAVPQGLRVMGALGLNEFPYSGNNCSKIQHLFPP